MKTLHCLVILIAVFCFTSTPTYSEEIPEIGFVSAKTKDFEVSTPGEVTVIESRKVEVEWTLDEIDYYLDIKRAQIEETQTAIKYFEALREKVKKAADKVKLKTEDEHRT